MRRTRVKKRTNTSNYPWVFMARERERERESDVFMECFASGGEMKGKLRRSVLWSTLREAAFGTATAQDLPTLSLLDRSSFQGWRCCCGVPACSCQQCLLQCHENEPWVLSKTRSPSVCASLAELHWTTRLNNMLVLYSTVVPL